MDRFESLYWVTWIIPETFLVSDFLASGKKYATTIKIGGPLIAICHTRMLSRNITYSDGNYISIKQLNFFDFIKSRDWNHEFILGFNLSSQTMKLGPMNRRKNNYSFKKPLQKLN